MPLDHLLLKLSVSTDLKELSRLRELLHKKAGRFGLTEDTVYLVVTAVDELCANMIEHDPKKWGAGKIHLTVRLDIGKIEVEILDRGGFFNPTRKKAEEVDIDEILTKRRGLGLFMVKKIMDEFSYSRTPEGDNLLVLRKYLTSGQQ